MKRTEDNIEYKNKRQPDPTAALSITEKRPELLAPAGELAGVIGAINAGADAVYLGAEAFSARAYAKNLSPEELLEALTYAHAFGRKIYLACNILLRDAEMAQIPGILDPLYEHGLDGIIVQDLGLLSFLHRRYPQLPLHASTQMSVLSAEGADWLKRMHVSRVVPGRELSLKELEAFKARDIEVECFIHGAMCYSYSGRCLLSSLAGGRSGNRGRCAGPCRQAYHRKDGKAQYLLSLKDMWSLHEIGALIDAGIDSFKIEGRMKAPEYTAGVTAVYRKYIDRYLQNGRYEIAPEDEKRLADLYLRSGKQEGYLRQHNGKNMISITSPAYGKVSEEEKERVFQNYIAEKKTIPVQMQARIFTGEPLHLCLRAQGQTVSVKGPLAEAAQNRAMTEEQFAAKLCRMGGTIFSACECSVDTDQASFVPVGQLNELRRNALEALQKKLFPNRSDLQEDILFAKTCENDNPKTVTPVLRVGLKTIDALEEVLAIPQIEGVILDLDPVADADPVQISSHIHSAGKRLYLRLPEIMRQKDIAGIRSRLQKTECSVIDGVYVNGVDAFAVAESFFSKEQLYADTGFYVFNSETEQQIRELVHHFTISTEWAGREYKGILDPSAAECLLYGYLPVMYSANCVLKTTGGCDRAVKQYELEDEKGHRFTIVPQHRYCYNVMYNCVPLSLHAELSGLLKRHAAGVYRLEFTIEKKAQIVQITKAYAGLWENGVWDAPFANGQTTKGHYARGAE